MKSIAENWKTSVAGIAVLAITAAFLLNRVPVDRYVAIMGLVASGGFFLSGDAKQK